MASIGHPLAGDTKYGFAEKSNKLFKYQALYSYKIRFNFITDAGNLEYLNGKEFGVKNVWFANNNKITV